MVIYLIYQVVEDCFINNITRNMLWRVLENFNHLQQVDKLETTPSQDAIVTNRIIALRVVGNLNLNLQFATIASCSWGVDPMDKWQMWIAERIRGTWKNLLQSRVAKSSREIKCCKCRKKNIRIIPKLQNRQNTCPRCTECHPPPAVWCMPFYGVDKNPHT